METPNHYLGMYVQVIESMSSRVEDIENRNEETVGDREEYVVINGMDDVGKVKFKTLTVNDLEKYHFGNVTLAYEFYNSYGKMNGFSVRKGKVGRNKKNEILWKNFYCSRQGYREDKYVNNPNPQRESRSMSRCKCQALMRVHVNPSTGLWDVSHVCDYHNHELVPPKFATLLRSQRRMTDADIAQLNSMRNVGIGTHNIYGSFVNQSGGFEMVGFRKREIYNQIQKQRRLNGGDAKAALRYLRSLASTDPAMFWRHTVDGDGCLQHLFWCDGSSQVDYQIFGDVLAFDATYNKNKYRCPLVVFSGVNHHNQTIVFGSAVVGNETEETYIWLLSQLLEAMKGKCPNAIITDGAMPMRNAIRRVIPQAHHRLCGWHLIRNATTNVGKTKFTQGFKECMLGDFEEDEFEQRWENLVKECDVQGHSWVQEIYANKRMWATALMRGVFFAGFRTTSRCEGLHAQIGRMVDSRYNLTEFLEQFQHYLTYQRNKEVEADYKSAYGQPVLKTHLHALERSAFSVYTLDVFFFFRKMLDKAALMKVVLLRETATQVIYMVTQYRKVCRRWHVSYCPDKVIFKCSCQRMESFGIPCAHLVAVIVFLDMDELPKSIILDRWTKKAKEAVVGTSQQGATGENSSYLCRYGALVDSCRRMCSLACRSDEDYNELRADVISKTSMLERKHLGHVRDADSNGGNSSHSTVGDPVRVGRRGVGANATHDGRQSKRRVRCGICRREGHIRTRCPLSLEVEMFRKTGKVNPSQSIAQDDDNMSNQHTNNDMDEDYYTSTEFATQGLGSQTNP